MTKAHVGDMNNQMAELQQRNQSLEDESVQLNRRIGGFIRMVQSIMARPVGSTPMKSPLRSSIIVRE